VFKGLTAQRLYKSFGVKGLMPTLPSVKHKTQTFTKTAHHTSIRLHSVPVSLECRTCALKQISILSICEDVT
jgi:hypothetical protein